MYVRDITPSFSFEASEKQRCRQSISTQKDEDLSHSIRYKLQLLFSRQVIYRPLKPTVVAYAFHFWPSMNFRVFIVKLSCKHTFLFTIEGRLNLENNHQWSATWYPPSLLRSRQFFVSRLPLWVSRLRWHDWCTIYLLIIHIGRSNYGYWTNPMLSWRK